MLDNLREEIKKIQGINHTEFDSMIDTWIKASKIDLKAIGIVDNYVDNPDSLIQSTMILFVLSKIDVVNSELYSNSYSIQKDTLRHITEYIEPGYSFETDEEVEENDGI